MTIGKAATIGLAHISDCSSCRSTAKQADVMLQYDGNTGNKCTCFMFLKPTMMSLKLLKLWEEKIVESQDVRNQVSS